MKRVGGLSALVVAITSMLVGVALLFGHAHQEPNRLRALGFDFCNEMPCWKGIVPGVTDWNIVRAIMIPPGGVESRGPGYTNIKSGIVDAPDSTVFALKLSAEQVVTSIDLVGSATVAQNTPSTSRLVDALDMFGTPCGVKGGSDPWQVLLLYSDVVIQVNARQGRIDPVTPIDYVEMFNPKQQLNQTLPPDLCKTDKQLDFVIFPWKGLASTDTYFAQPAKLSDQ